MKLFFRQVGEKGQPLVILHGIFGSSDNWLSVAKVLSEHFRVFLLDQRNHGQSPRSEDFSYQEMAADLKEFLEDHDLEDPILVGHSMGGKTVMQFAIDYPVAFDKLVVVDIAPKFYPVHHTGILQGLNTIDLPTLQTRQQADEILARYEDNPAVRQFLLKNLYRNATLGHFDWRINLPVITREIHGVGEELTTNKAIAKPVLFIKGSASNYILPEDFKDIQRIFPNAKLETIEGAGHWVQADKPKEFCEILLVFGL